MCVCVCVCVCGLHVQVPPQPPPFVDDAFYDSLLRSSLEEMTSEYAYSMKKAIVNYVIMWVHESQT